jgi:MarR family transcriptional regulator, lower aerobic nicotinate degradation pathway regulator
MATTPTPVTPSRPGPPKELLASNGFLLKKVGWSMKERMHRFLEPTGVNPQHYAVLSVLAQGTCTSQATIADSLAWDRSQLVGLLDELEDHGYVARKRDPDDRRRHLVNLTPAGEQALAKLRAASREAELEFLAPLDEEEQRVLHELLLRLARANCPMYSELPDA